MTQANVVPIPILPLIHGPHERTPWANRYDEKVFVTISLNKLKGIHRPSSRRTSGQNLYELAKFKADKSAAYEILVGLDVDRIKDIFKYRIISRTKNGEKPAPLYVICPRPEFDDEDSVGFRAPEHGSPNRLSVAFAEYLGIKLGAIPEWNIHQVARVDKKKMDKFCRLIWHPIFEGAVVPGANYIVVDDVFTMGGTIASLRGYIIKGGGTFLGAAALAHGSGADQAFAIKDATSRALVIGFDKGLDGFWKERVGYGIECLTDGEGRFLLTQCKARSGAQALHRLRNRIAQETRKGRTR